MRLSVILIGFAVLLWTASQAGVPVQDGESAFDEAWVQHCYEEAVEALEQGAQIRLARPVEVVLLTAEEALERRKTYAQTLDEHAGLTVSMDLMADLVFSSVLIGRYFPDEKVCYLIRDVLLEQSEGDVDAAAEMLFGVMAHELVHAYDDQTYEVVPMPAAVEAAVADGGKLPEFQTLMSLLEGRATYAAELAARHAGRPVLPAASLEGARHRTVIQSGEGFASGLAAGLGNTLARAKLVQYVYGRRFAEAAFRFGGEKFFAQVFGSLPLSMKELEDFNVFKLRWADEMEARLEHRERGPGEGGTDAGADAGADRVRPEGTGAGR